VSNPIVKMGSDGAVSKRMILVEGPSGVGKTHQCRTLIEGGMKVLVPSTERKLSTIKDLEPDVWPITDFDFPTTGVEKAAILKRGSENVIALFDYLRAGDHTYDACYFDSMMRYAWKLFELLRSTTKNEAGKADTLRAYGVFGTKMKVFLDLIASVTDGTTSKRPVHFIGTWGVERGQDSQVVPVIDGKQIGPLVDYHFDDVLMLRMENDGRDKKYTMHTAGESTFAAKVSAPPNIKVPEVIENPNLFKLIGLLEGGK